MLHRLLPLLLALIPVTAAADDADHVRLTLTGPAVPYASIVHDLARERGAVVATVTKRFADGFGHRSEVGLLTDRDLTQLLTELTALGAFTLPPRTTRAPRTIYTLSIRRGDRHRTLTVHDPEWSPETRHRALFDRIRAASAAHTDPIPFRDALLLPHEAGTLWVRSTPPATVALDGVPLPGGTPMTDLRVTAGPHRLTLTPIGGGEPRDYDITIRAGKTTSLTLDLR